MNLPAPAAADRLDAADGSRCADGVRRPGERQPRLGRRNRRRRRRPVQRPPRHERRLHADDCEPDRAADRDELHRLGARRGTYYYKVTAEDAAGNVGAASNEATVTVALDTTPPTAPAT